MVFLFPMFYFLSENKSFSPGSFESICALQLRLLCVQVFYSPTPRGSPQAPLPRAASAVSACGRPGWGGSLIERPDGSEAR